MEATDSFRTATTLFLSTLQQNHLKRSSIFSNNHYARFYNLQDANVTSNSQVRALTMAYYRLQEIKNYEVGDILQ
jgi:hypothetical protein